MTDTDYINQLKQLGFACISTGGGCEAMSKTLSNGNEVLITADGDPSVPLASELACITIGDESEFGLSASEVIKRAAKL